MQSTRTYWQLPCHMQQMQPSVELGKLLEKGRPPLTLTSPLPLPLPLTLTLTSPPAPLHPSSPSPPPPWPTTVRRSRSFANVASVCCKRYPEPRRRPRGSCNSSSVSDGVAAGEVFFCNFFFYFEAATTAANVAACLSAECR